MEGTQWSRGFRTLVLVLLFVLAALIALARMTHGMADPDMFWHVETGRWIFEHRAIPHTDVLSWYGQTAGLPWVPHEWLWDVGAFGVYAVGGYAGLYAATAALYGLLAVLVFQLLRRRVGNELRALLLTVVISAGAYIYAMPRPQVLTYLLLVTLLIALERGWWYVAPAIVLVIANTHGGTYPLFLFVIALYTLPGKKPVAFVLSVAALALQPNGLSTLMYPFAFGPEAKELQEWAPTVLASQPVMLVTAVAFAALVQWRDVKWRDALLAMAGAGLSIVAVRHVPFFFLLAVPALAPYLPETVEPDPSMRRKLDPMLVGVLAAGCLAMAVLASSEPFDPAHEYPQEASRYLEARGIEHFWNEWGDGGFLIARGLPPFVDGRADPFFSEEAEGGRFIGEYTDVVRLRKDIRPMLRTHRIEYVLLGNETPLYQVLAQSADFARVYSDGRDSVFRYLSSEENTIPVQASSPLAPSNQ